MEIIAKFKTLMHIHASFHGVYVLVNCEEIRFSRLCLNAGCDTSVGFYGPEYPKRIPKHARLISCYMQILLSRSLSFVDQGF